MVRSAIRALAAVLLIVGMLSERAQAIPPVNTIQWQGGSTGEWNNADAWKNATTNVTGNAATLMGQRDGSDGMNNINPATTRARNIVIGGGSTVSYYYPTGNGAGTSGSDFRLRQGTSLTVTGGATFLIDQTTFTNMSGNAWGRMDPSNLILDNGTFWKKGQPPDQVPEPPDFPGGPVGGGPTIFGSFNVDNNLERLGEPVVNIQIKNGGQFKNDGQFWFGTDGENTPDTRVSMNINNGSLDLSGGDVYFVENGDLIVNADLAFFYDYQERSPVDLGQPVVRPARPKNEKYEVNFTGPGSVTVDNAGIWVYRQNASGTWNEGMAGPLSYQELWNMGILKSNGLSGRTGTLFGDGAGPRNLTPANFDNFFTVTGTPGEDNYTLTAKPTTTIATVEWVGGATGEWNNADAWKNTTTNVTGNALTLMGQRDGSDGMNNIDPATTRARNIVIGGGATVEYYYPTANGAGTGSSDFRLRQGTSLTITGGATFLVDQSDYPNNSGNAWMRMDPSNLIIDNGTFWKKGQPPDQVPDPPDFPGGPVGGGPTIFGSFNVDNNLERLGEPVVNIQIKNGGQLKNDGQLWFGTDGENTPDTRVSMSINNGHMDLSGGDVYFVENGDLIVNADLAFFYDYQERSPVDPGQPEVRPARPKDEKYEINFTGPGSITVDNSGIWVYEQSSTGTWNEGTAGPLEYLDLWEMGILKANGLSGRTDVLFGDGAGPRTMTPADFNTFFSVTGMPGMDDYKLTSLIEGPPAVIGVAGDYNNNGVVDAADYVLWRDGGNLQNDSSPGVQPEDYNVWRANFGRTLAPGSGAALSAAVPEPAAGLMLLVGMLLPFSLRRARAVVQ